MLLEWHPGPGCEVPESQPFQLSCRPRAEQPVAYVEFPRKGQYAGPASRCDLPLAASKLPCPSPEQRTVWFGQYLRRVKGWAVIDHTSGRGLEYPSPAVDEQVAE